MFVWMTKAAFERALADAVKHERDLRAHEAAIDQRALEAERLFSDGLAVEIEKLRELHSEVVAGRHARRATI